MNKLYLYSGVGFSLLMLTVYIIPKVYYTRYPQIKKEDSDLNDDKIE